MLKKTLVIALIGLMVGGVVVGVVSLAQRSTPSGGRGQEQASGARADLSQGQGRGQRFEVSEGGDGASGAVASVAVASVAAANGGRNFEAENEDCDCEDCTSGDGYKGQMTGSRSAGQGSGRFATEQAALRATGARGAEQSSGRYAAEQATGGRNSVAGQGVGGGGGNSSQANSQAELVEQITVESTVVAMGEHIIIELEDGTELELGMGPTFYRDEIGFTTEVGDTLTVTGFHEDGEFKVLSIVDESGTLMTFRDEYGRPGWSGRGNRDSQATK